MHLTNRYRYWVPLVELKLGFRKFRQMSYKAIIQLKKHRAVLMACEATCYEPISFKSCINTDSNLVMYLQWVFKLLLTVAEICVSHHRKNFVLGTFCQIKFTFFRHMLPFTNTLTLASSLKSEHFHWVSCSEDSYALDYSKLQHNSISPNLSIGTFCLNTVDLSWARVAVSELITKFVILLFICLSTRRWKWIITMIVILC